MEQQLLGGEKNNNNNFILLVLLATQYVKVFLHANQFSETSWVSCNLTRFCNCSSGDSIRPHSFRFPSHRVASPTDATPKARVLTCASDDPLAVNQVPTTLFLGLILCYNSLQNSVSLLFDHFIMERYNSVTVKWQRWIAKVQKKSEVLACLLQAVTLLAPPCVHQPGGSAKVILQGFLWTLQ